MTLALRSFHSTEVTMTAMNIFYRERAEDARKGAAEATLTNVRERWLVSEATWAQLADRSERAETVRSNLILQKAAERDAMRSLGQS
jgi:hypothetical protein